MGSIRYSVGMDCADILLNIIIMENLLLLAGKEISVAI